MLVRCESRLGLGDLRPCLSHLFNAGRTAPLPFMPLQPQQCGLRACNAAWLMCGTWNCTLNHRGHCAVRHAAHLGREQLLCGMHGRQICSYRVRPGMHLGDLSQVGSCFSSQSATYCAVLRGTACIDVVGRDSYIYQLPYESTLPCNPFFCKAALLSAARDLLLVHCAVLADQSAACS